MASFLSGSNRQQENEKSVCLSRNKGQLLTHRSRSSQSVRRALERKCSKQQLRTERDTGNFRGAWRLGFQAFTHETWVQSLFGELRSHQLTGADRKNGTRIKNTNWPATISPNIRPTILLKMILPDLDPEKNRRFSLYHLQRTVSSHWGSKPELLCYFCECQWRQTSEAMNKR